MKVHPIRKVFHGENIKIPKGYKWLAIDDNGSIGAFKTRPWRSVGFWDCPSNEVRKEVGKLNINKITDYSLTLQQVKTLHQPKAKMDKIVGPRERLNLAKEVNALFDKKDEESKGVMPAFPPKDFDFEKWKANTFNWTRDAYGVITMLQGLGYKITKGEWHIITPEQHVMDSMS